MNRPHTSAPDHLVFDASVLGAMFGDDAAVIASVLETFLVSTRGNLPKLVVAAAAQNLNDVTELAHKMTGACRMSGAQALGYAARSVEEAAKRGDAASVQQGMANIQSQWTVLLAAIDKLKQPGT